MMVEIEGGVPIVEKDILGSTVFIPRGAYYSTFNKGWEPTCILAVYSPPGPEVTRHDGKDFSVLPADVIPDRSK